jgi:hypothetical protein
MDVLLGATMPAAWSRSVSSTTRSRQRAARAEVQAAIADAIAAGIESQL